MDLYFYWQLLRRRLHWIVLLSIVGAIVGVAVALALPPSFRSQAVLIVESEQIPGELASTTVNTGETEALQIIRQRILSREVLLELANRFQIFEDPTAITADNKVSDLRSRILIDTAGGQVRRGARDATIVTVSFTAPKANLSAQVANEIVTLILQENVEMRTSVARQTLDFFTQEVDRLEQSLSTVSAQILDFQENNLESLPDSLEFRRSQQASIQERLFSLDREQAALKERRAQMVILFEATGMTEFNSNGRGGSQRPGVTLSPEAQALEALNAEYAQLSAVLSENNPRMVLLRNRIEAAERAVEAAPEPADPAEDGAAAGEGEQAEKSVEDSLFEIQLSDIDAQIAYIENQKAALSQQMQDLSRTIRQTPGNAVTLATLERSYANLQEQYNLAVANRARAETGSMIESLSRGQRISVVEQAVAPENPVSPNRPLVAIGGLMGGLVIGLALFALSELLNRSVRRPQDLQNALGIETFATIPYMSISGEASRRRATAVLSFAGVAAALAVAIWYVDTKVQPILPMVERILN